MRRVARSFSALSAPALTLLLAGNAFLAGACFTATAGAATPVVPNSVHAFGTTQLGDLADQAWGISAGVTVALKNGWQVNSIGWISGGGREYTLAILTETISAVSSMVYSALSAA